MRTSVTSTRSKVKVEVTELPKLRKLHFSRSISSAVLAWSSKLVGGDSIGPGLQLVGAQFLNFLRKAITRVQTLPVVDISRNSNDHISVVEPAILALFPNTGISILEKINTGIQGLPILAVVDATKCKQCVVNDRLMSA